MPPLTVSRISSESRMAFMGLSPPCARPTDLGTFDCYESATLIAGDNIVRHVFRSKTQAEKDLAVCGAECLFEGVALFRDDLLSFIGGERLRKYRHDRRGSGRASVIVSPGVVADQLADFDELADVLARSHGDIRRVDRYRCLFCFRHRWRGAGLFGWLCIICRRYGLPQGP